MNELNQAEEFAIIRECLRGRTDQYALLVERYKSLAYNLAYRIVGDPDTANDMAQESFISAYRGLKDFQYSSKFSSWLYTIVLNKCRDYLRTRRPTVSVDDVAEVRTDRKPSPEDSASSRQEGGRLQEALSALPPEYREVLVLKHIEELDYREIAGLLGVSVGALKVRAHRGREMLRKILETAGATYGH